MKNIIYKSPKLPKQQDYQIPIDELGVLKVFEEKLKNTSFDLRIFYENCKDLDFLATKKLDNTFFFSTDAEYDMIFNRIQYNADNMMGIFHELFHMASNIVGHQVIYNGFSQIQPGQKLAFGFGLKEAYTCILDERYFGSQEKHNYYQSVYTISRSLTENLENLLGKENMELWYSEADLPSLIKELGKYFGCETAIKFIDALDKIAYYNEYGGLENPLISVTNYRFALTFLGRCLIKKYALDYYLNDDDAMAYLKKLDDVRHMMMQRMVYPSPFKIIKSRKYSDKKFEHDVDTIEQKIVKKYSDSSRNSRE